jgi:hypothetical protein
MANRALWTARLQRRRLSTTEPEDNEFVFRFWADLEFLILALWHIRIAALLARRVAIVSLTIQAAIDQFDAALPGLRTMRNVIEHLDEYGVDIGRQQDISRKQLQVGAWDGVTFQWLALKLNVDDAVAAGKALNLAVYRAKHDHPRTSALSPSANSRSIDHTSELSLDTVIPSSLAFPVTDLAVSVVGRVAPHDRGLQFSASADPALL